MSHLLTRALGALATSARGRLAVTLAVALPVLALAALLFTLAGCGGGLRSLAERVTAAELLGARPPWGMFGKDETGKRRSEHKGPNRASIRWTFTGFSNLNGAPVIGADGSVYTESCSDEGDGLGRIYALNSNGTMRWSARSFVVQDGAGTASGLSIMNNTATSGTDVLLHGTRSALTAYDAASGTELWKTVFEPDGWTRPSRPVVAGEVIYMTTGLPGNIAGYLTAIAADGTLLWRNTSSNFMHEIVGVAADGTVYAAPGAYGGYGVLTAYNPDGTTKWVGNVGDLSWFAAPAIGDNGDIYVMSGVKSSDFQSKMRAINPVDGSTRWTYNFPPLIDGNHWRYSTIGLAVGPDGNVHYGEGQYKHTGGRLGWTTSSVFCIRPDGTLKYTFTKKGAYQTSGSAPAVDANGTVYLASALGGLIAISSSGSLVWSKSLISGYMDSSPAIGGDGTIYIGAGAKLYAIGPGTP